MCERREDEILALESIYGPALSVTREGDAAAVAGGVVNIKALQPPFIVEFVLPSDYPESSPMVSVKASDGRRSELEDLRKDLACIVKASAGEEVLFHILERVKASAEASEGRGGGYEKEEQDEVGEGEEEEEDRGREEDDAQEQEAEEGEEPKRSFFPRKAEMMSTQLHEKTLEDLTIYHSEPMVERKSTFIAHLCLASSMQQVEAFRALICSHKSYSRATHNIFVYRFACPESGVVHADCDDDGETAAGSRLAEMVRLMGATGVAIIVSRWFGGQLLGPDRFKYINNVAKKLLEDKGFGDARTASTTSSKKKGAK